MTSLHQFLTLYQAHNDFEKNVVEILRSGLSLKALRENSGLTARQQRRWEFEWKKWRSHLLLQVFYRLPNLSRPHREIATQYRDEYDSLLNEIAAEFVCRILMEFDPDLGVRGSSLTAKLSIWVNSKLRLKWRLLELITPQKKTRELQLLELILNLTKRSPDGFTKSEFLLAIAPKKNITEAWATEFLLELLPRFWSSAPEGDRYFFDDQRLETYIDQWQQPLYVITLDPAIATQIPAPDLSPVQEDIPTLSEKITNLLLENRSQLEKICVKNNPSCNCVRLLENYFQQQLYQVKINEENVTRLLGVKRPTYQSHLERKCLPAFWELAIYTSPVSQINHKTHQIPLKNYIEIDPKYRLRKCYYSDRNGVDYINCNSQNLATQILLFFTPKPEKWKNLALFYQLSCDTLMRFWKMKCLFLISLITFELESELTDCVEVD
ncbi:hypothetical protein [[Limnothrix rosea] IAM M-220]|uniref:hypothetical protein n=1 Tax=[Limnothrix rosea] IAM M-220 TaxID=454133 RepID=UPI00095E396F|nr:hypothetical protein [[Limnothrix rosea] IAM M-220]OKH18122.1 hypothetical protein NIES208_07205 [[Limnothrix rosea] IAM M-220]